MTRIGRLVNLVAPPLVLELHADFLFESLLQEGIGFEGKGVGKRPEGGATPVISTATLHNFIY